MTPLHLVCLSNIRVKDLRKFVYMYVKPHFKKLTKNNIELAFRRKTVVNCIVPPEATAPPHKQFMPKNSPQTPNNEPEKHQITEPAQQQTLGGIPGPHQVFSQAGMHEEHKEQTCAENGSQ